jgi:hypothetical protein
MASRRLQGLQILQGKISLLRPKNYGTLTSVVVYGMRHIMITPLVQTNFLKLALEELRKSQVQEKFGMLFFHEMDLSKPAQMSLNFALEDGEEVRKHYGSSLQKQVHTNQTDQHKIPAHLEQNAQGLAGKHPWGLVISWKELELLLGTLPHQFISQEPLWSQPQDLKPGKDATTFFVDLTTFYWAVLGGNYTSEINKPKPASFLDAKNSWRVDHILKIVTPGSFQLHPSFKNPEKLSKISDAPKFSALIMEHIFHPLTKGFKKWEELAWRTNYKNFKDSWNPQRFAAFCQDLASIFDSIQCFPAPNDAGNWWTMEKFKIKFVTNPVFYRVESVVGKSKAMGQPRAQATGKELKKTLNAFSAPDPLTQTTGSKPKPVIKKVQNQQRRRIPTSYDQGKAQHTFSKVYKLRSRIVNNLETLDMDDGDDDREMNNSSEENNNNESDQDSYHSSYHGSD